LKNASINQQFAFKKKGAQGKAVAKPANYLVINGLFFDVANTTKTSL